MSCHGQDDKNMGYHDGDDCSIEFSLKSTSLFSTGTKSTKRLSYSNSFSTLNRSSRRSLLSDDGPELEEESCFSADNASVDLNDLASSGTLSTKRLAYAASISNGRIIHRDDLVSSGEEDVDMKLASPPRLLNIIELNAELQRSWCRIESDSDYYTDDDDDDDDDCFSDSSSISSISASEECYDDEETHDDELFFFGECYTMDLKKAEYQKNGFEAHMVVTDLDDDNSASISVISSSSSDDASLDLEEQALDQEDENLCKSPSSSQSTVIGALHQVGMSSLTEIADELLLEKQHASKEDLAKLSALGLLNDQQDEDDSSLLENTPLPTLPCRKEEEHQELLIGNSSTQSIFDRVTAPPLFSPTVTRDECLSGHVAVRSSCPAPNRVANNRKIWRPAFMEPVPFPTGASKQNTSFGKSFGALSIRLSISPSTSSKPIKPIQRISNPAA